MVTILGLLPHRVISRLVGWLFALRLPAPLAAASIRLFAKVAGIDLSALHLPPEHYPTIGAFFLRDSVPGSHPVDPSGESLCCPVDATLRHVQPVTAGQLCQVKGVSYSLAQLLGSEEEARCFEDGKEINLYLSPRDYHHVHAPIEGEIISARYISGRLWPVNDWSLRRVRNLFAVNERLVVFMRRGDARFALVMVGALNVGDLVAKFDPSLTRSAQPIVERVYSTPLAIRCGDRLGSFCLGSSVILLAGPGSVGEIDSTPRAVKWGSALGRLIQPD